MASAPATANAAAVKATEITINPDKVDPNYVFWSLVVPAPKDVRPTFDDLDKRDVAMMAEKNLFANIPLLLEHNHNRRVGTVVDHKVDPVSGALSMSYKLDQDNRHTRYAWAEIATEGIREVSLAHRLTNPVTPAELSLCMNKGRRHGTNISKFSLVPGDAAPEPSFEERVPITIAVPKTGGVQQPSVPKNPDTTQPAAQTPPTPPSATEKEKNSKSKPPVNAEEADNEQITIPPVQKVLTSKQVQDMSAQSTPRSSDPNMDSANGSGAATGNAGGGSSIPSNPQNGGVQNTGTGNNKNGSASIVGNRTSNIVGNDRRNLRNAAHGHGSNFNNNNNNGRRADDVRGMPNRRNANNNNGATASATASAPQQDQDDDYGSEDDSNDHADLDTDDAPQQFNQRQYPQRRQQQQQQQHASRNNRGQYAKNGNNNNNPTSYDTNTDDGDDGGAEPPQPVIKRRQPAPGNYNDPHGKRKADPMGSRHWFGNQPATKRHATGTARAGQSKAAADADQVTDIEMQRDAAMAQSKYFQAREAHANAFPKVGQGLRDQLMASMQTEGKSHAEQRSHFEFAAQVLNGDLAKLTQDRESDAAPAAPKRPMARAPVASAAPQQRQPKGTTPYPKFGANAPAQPKAQARVPYPRNGAQSGAAPPAMQDDGAQEDGQQQNQPAQEDETDNQQNSVDSNEEQQQQQQQPSHDDQKMASPEDVEAYANQHFNQASGNNVPMPSEVAKHIQNSLFGNGASTSGSGALPPRTPQNQRPKSNVAAPKKQSAYAGAQPQAFPMNTGGNLEAQKRAMWGNNKNAPTRPAPEVALFSNAGQQPYVPSALRGDTSKDATTELYAIIAAGARGTKTSGHYTGLDRQLKNGFHGFHYSR